MLSVGKGASLPAVRLDCKGSEGYILEEGEGCQGGGIQASGTVDERFSS